MVKQNTMMRVPKELLHELNKCKLVERESYAGVVARLIEKERKFKK
jgi:predicted CopG family antitoxin